MTDFKPWGSSKTQKLRTARPEWVYVPPFEYRPGREPQKADYRYEESYLEHLREYKRIRERERVTQREEDTAYQEKLNKLLKENGGALPSVDYFK